jgi:hypothetical protein
MAIRINLLAEAQTAEEQRRKNPIKRGIWIGGFFVATMLLWMLRLQLDIHFSNSHFNSLNQEWVNNQARFGDVTNNIAQTAEMEKKLAALDRLATNRFFWAPVLNVLQQTVVDDIQVIRVNGQQTYTREVAKKAGTSNVTEKITLYLEARDYNPGAETYNKFKETLCNADYFVKILGRRDGFILDGTLSAPIADPTDLSRQFVTFKLTSRFPEAKRSD